MLSKQRLDKLAKCLVGQETEQWIHQNSAAI